MTQIDGALRQRILAIQRDEVTEQHVYRALAKRQQDPANKELLERIARDEARHAEYWSTLTETRVGPNRIACWWYGLMARTLGLTFAVRLMERAERNAQAVYAELADAYPESVRIGEEEEEHESMLVAMIDEERLRYVGSVVLGLSDALVELTGALAGLTLALQDTRTIGMDGLVTGLAAAMSMGASEYLSTKAEEGDEKKPGKAAVYTSVTYLLTVLLLIVPYLVLSTPLPALALTLGGAMLIILFFTYYVAVAKDAPLWSRFLEMGGVTLFVAAASFCIGFLVRILFGIDA